MRITIVRNEQCERYEIEEGFVSLYCYDSGFIGIYDTLSPYFYSKDKPLINFVNWIWI